MIDNFLLLMFGMVGFIIIVTALLAVLGFLFAMADKKFETYDMKYRIPEGKTNE